MAGVSLLFALLALLVTVGGGVLLYVLVRSEHDQRTVTDRESAEKMARRDTVDDGGIGDGNHWD